MAVLQWVSDQYGANSIQEPAIDWGTGSNQISADDIPDGSTYAIISLTQETNFGTAYTHSQAAHAPSNADQTSSNETSHSDVLQDGDFSSNGLMSRAGVGSYAIVSDNSANWDTAYGWGDHASGGYLTSETSHADVVVDGDFGLDGILVRSGGAGSYSTITDGSTNWDAAYSHVSTTNNPHAVEWSDVSAVDIINETHIDHGSGANQIDATSILLDSGGSYAGSATTVQDALEEIEANPLAGREVLLHRDQLSDANDRVDAAIPLTLPGLPDSGDVINLTDGVTTRGYGATTGGDVQYTPGGTVATAMAALAAAIEGDGSGLWSAVFVADGLDEIDTDGVVTIIADATTNTSQVYRNIGIWSNGVPKVVDYSGVAEYTKVSLSDMATSGSEIDFGPRRGTPYTGEQHLCLTQNSVYAWDGATGVWYHIGGGGHENEYFTFTAEATKNLTYRILDTSLLKRAIVARGGQVLAWSDTPATTSEFKLADNGTNTVLTIGGAISGGLVASYDFDGPAA